MSTPVQTALGAFVWHDLATRDPQRAEQFYTALLGWQTEQPGELDYRMIVADGKPHGGFWPPAEEGLPSGWIGHVLVDDVDAAADRAKAAGGSLLFGPTDAPEGRRFAVIRDPEGAVVSAYSSPEESSPPEGVFVWDELYADDIDGAKRFYSDVFGWTTSEMDMGDGRQYTIFSSGDQQRAGGMAKPPGMQAPSHWLVYIQCDDVDAYTGRAKELGGQIYMEPFDVPTVGRMAIGADPTGAPFALFKGEE